MTRPLGPTQRLVLCVLDSVEPDGAPPTAAEIADQMAEFMQLAHDLRRPTTETEAAQGCLARLARRGLVQRLGTAHNGARCWAITDAGRTALAEDGVR
jgi:hypothetical protein